ncbi:MAG TPA: hypothetical protein VE129_06640 [Thermoanaerobaculia bacterium]|nr:hypothetical protein [Thermoanaerobaculia bacterium]
MHPVMKALLFAVSALLFGVLAVVVPDRLFPPEMNYRTISVLGEAFQAFVLGSFRFALGAFAGLTLAAGLTSLGGGGARRPVALVLSSLFALAVVGVSGFGFRGLTHFPSRGSIEERHRWAGMRLDRPYREVVAWAAASPAVQEACGEALRFGPAPGTRNVVLVGSSDWTATLTLDVEGEKGSARLAVTAVLPFSPPDARPVVRSGTLAAGGGRTGLDSAGNALGR